MAQRSHLPEFGNWDSEDNVPYTAYFDKARKGRTGGKMINPNDPQENPDLLTYPAAQTRASPARVKAYLDEPIGHSAARKTHDRRRSKEDGEAYLDEPIGHSAAKKTHDRRRSKEDVDFKQFADSPARHERKPAGGSTPSRFSDGGDAQKRHGRQIAGSENSFERSPLHHQARIPGRTSGMSSTGEGKNSYDSSHGTPGRSKPRLSDSVDQGAAVPRFGDWDENNPASADGFTHIFNKVREERNNGGRASGMPGEQSPYNSARRMTPASSSKSCCFPWGRK